MKNQVKNLFTNRIQKIKEIRKEMDADDLLDLNLMDADEELTISSPGRKIWSDHESTEKETLWKRFKSIGRVFRNRWLIVGILIAMTALGLYVYGLNYIAEEYKVLSSDGQSEINGTEYVSFGKKLLKYSSDGVFCLNSKEELLWSSTYSIQTPVLDVCQTTAAIAEKGGTQVYIYDHTGQIGQFKTLLPIEKIRVANQGMVSVVLEDENTTWINFYDSKGELLAENKTSLEESGYPLDVDLSPDGIKVMVSYLQTMEGNIRTNVVFYDFDSLGKAEINNQIYNEFYDNVVIPEVHFIDAGTSVAFRTDGFSIYKGKQIPEETVSVSFDKEILSVFYNESQLGFVVASDKKEHKYIMQLYNLNGKKTMETYFDFAYKDIRLDGNRILMSNDGEFVLYSTKGRLKGKVKYQSPFTQILPLEGFRKYIVRGQESTEVIRLK